MDRKVVFFDIDGTIYNYDVGIPEDTVYAITKLRENGHIPVICTGRTKSQIYDEHMALGFENMVAGAGTYVEVGGKQKYLKELDDEETHRLLNGFLQYNFVPIAEGKKNLYLGTDYSDMTPENKKFFITYQEKVPERVKTIDESEIKISKISGGFTGHSDMESMISEFSDKYNIVNHEYSLLELIPKGCSKGKGIEIMLNELDISRENTYAFGDSLNDLSMLEYVKYGCAMGNGCEEIKQKVKYTTDDFDKGGIYNGLKRFGLI